MISYKYKIKECVLPGWRNRCLYESIFSEQLAESRLNQIVVYYSSGCLLHLRKIKIVCNNYSFKTRGYIYLFTNLYCVLTGVPCGFVGFNKRNCITPISNCCSTQIICVIIGDVRRQLYIWHLSANKQHGTVASL